MTTEHLRVKEEDVIIPNTVNWLKVESRSESALAIIYDVCAYSIPIPITWHTQGDLEPITCNKNAFHLFLKKKKW